MTPEIVWLAPLLILPGISLLILSTSNRYSELHHEIHHWLEDNAIHDAAMLEDAHLVTRAVLFRNALVSLYAAVFLFVLASLCGAVMDFMGWPADVVVFAIAALGILIVGFASLELIRESMLSLEVIRAHMDHIMDTMSEMPDDPAASS